MKKILLAVVTVPAVLLLGYATYARLTTRGLRVYLEGTQKGSFLVASWQPALLAGVVLAIPLAIFLIRSICRLLRPRKAKAEADTVLYESAEARIEPLRGSETVPTRTVQSKRTRLSSGKTKRASTGETQDISLGQGAATAQAGLIEPAAPAPAAAGTVLLESNTAGTVLLEPAQAGLIEPAAPAPAAAGTVLLENNTAGTVLLEPAQAELIEPAAPEQKPIQPAQTGPRFCANCGNSVVGQKFCSRCGKKVQD